jgi:hypothetical protein
MEWAKLQYLTLDGGFHAWNDSQFLQAARNGHLPKLRHLVLRSNTPLRCWDLLGWNMPELESIDFEMSPDFFFAFEPQEDFRPFEHMRNLTRFKVFWNGIPVWVDDEPLFGQFLRRVITDTVTDLHVDTYDHADLTLDALSALPGVLFFTVSYPWVISNASDDFAPDLLRTFPNLTKLRVVNIGELTAPALANSFGDLISRGLGEGWHFVVTKTTVREDGEVGIQECEFSL